MACHLALLALLALAGALGPPDLCEYETNKIKDLLQASCVGKGLTKVPPGLQNDIGILLLGSNHLARVSTVSFQNLHNLTDLDLSYNGMGELEAPSPLPSLRELDLSHNALKNLPALRGFPNLVRLALGHNALSWIPEGSFHALGRLEDLELQGNQLHSLPDRAFTGLETLNDLDLSDNHLTMLPPKLLDELKLLQTLRLERNRLRSLPKGFFDGNQTFAYVYLVGNPWLCDCALEYLSNWTAENPFVLYTRVQGPEKEITENEPEHVTCEEPPEERGQPVMYFHANCRPEGHRRGWGDEEQTAELQTTSSGPNRLSTPPLLATTPAFFTQPEPTAPSSPRSKATSPAHSPTPATPPSTLGSLAPTVPTTTTVPTAAAATSPLGLPLVSTTAAAPPSTSPTALASLAPTVPTTTTVPTAAAATSPLGLPPASTTVTPGSQEPATTPSPPPQAMSTAEAPPTPRPTALMLPASTRPSLTARLPMPVPLDPPAYCQCPMLPGVALGLTRQQPPPVSWGAWLAVRCCPLRLALYVACLVLVSLANLVVLCWWGWACGRGTWYLAATQDARGPQLPRHLQQQQPAACERHQGPGEDRCRPLPGPRLYRVCKKLEVGPLRHVTWLLISLPGPSGQWPWERKGSFPSYSLGRGKGDPGAEQVECAASTL